jgi:hypothetical protein
VQVLVCARDALLPCRIQDGLPRGVIAIPRNLAGHPAEELLGEGQTFAPASVKPVRGR